MVESELDSNAALAHQVLAQRWYASKWARLQWGSAMGIGVVSEYSTQFAEIAGRIAAADTRYGPFKSTHEAMGVGYEEWIEFTDAVRSNILADIYEEALDLAAVMIRLAGSLQDDAFKFDGARAIAHAHGGFEFGQ